MAALSIAVVGVGGIGSTFASQLARAGHDVTVVARPGSLRLQQLERDRGIVHKTQAHVAIGVTGALNEQEPYDLVLVTTLAHQVEAILPALQRSQAKHVHFMFNTFTPDRVREAVGGHRCSFGMPFIMARLDADGVLDATINPFPKSLHGDPRWVELFHAAGIPSALEADMLLWLRCHVPICIAMESISVAGERRGGGAAWADSVRVARGLQAGFAVVKGLGFRLYPAPKALLSALPTAVVACMLWCISRIRSFRELLATGIHECRALVDVVVAAAHEAKLDLPDAVARVQAMKPDVAKA